MSRSGGSRSDGDGEAIRGNHCVRDDEDTRIEVGDDDGKSRERQGHERRRGGTVAARPRKSGQRALLV
ncbi:BnaC06g26350D [Brassica napus]|uniref:BnaC06g26350D protein n=1 Tax=Brassica napus TaxID=3708 RepID=A0A078GUS7_BRANA|nr:BnaC06g26350D [Brassica napus]